MFKLVVLSALIAIAVAAPRPSYLHAEPAIAYTAAVVPAAVSHQSRVDIHSKPLIATTYTAPAVVAAPAIHTYAAPAIHTYAAPAIHTYAAPALVHSAPLLSHGLVDAHLAYAHY